MITIHATPPWYFKKLTRISRGTDDSSVQSFEFLDTLRESNDFSGADKGEIHRVPEEDNVLALVVREGDILEFTINDSGSSESGSLLLNLSDYKVVLVCLQLGIDHVHTHFR